MAITSENRKLFESLGVEGVRIDLLRGFEGNLRVPRGPARDIEAPEWLKEQEHENADARRYAIGSCWWLR
jgi:hypothetical protein